METLTPPPLEPSPVRPATLADIDTPALILDLDALDANIAAMSGEIAARGKQWRPHAKGHKSPAIARRQIAAGAIGVTVAKTSEAEVFAAAGLHDILIANCIVGDIKARRVAELCRKADPIVCCDHYLQAEALSRVCVERGVRCRVLIEINIGLDRSGVRPGRDAQQLARAVARLAGVTLSGVMGYEGHLLAIDDPDEKRTRVTSAIGMLIEARDQLEAAGYPCPIVSAGGTGSYQITSGLEGVTELQAGGGIFADPFYTEACGVQGVIPALAVLATVVSRPRLERAVLDCGRKSLCPDVHPSHIVRRSDGLPLPDAAITVYSAEHLTLELGPRSQDLHIGDKVLVRPGYSDLTTVLHERYFAVRGERVEEVLPVVARGALQ